MIPDLDALAKHGDHEAEDIFHPLAKVQLRLILSDQSESEKVVLVLPILPDDSVCLLSHQGCHE
jgi:hypothetical protein